MCKNANWDEILAYPTVKIVKVKDRYLGGIRYVFMFAIFAYIIGYVVLYDKGYNECTVPDGSIQLSLLKPPGMIYPANYSYCKQNPNANTSDPLPCVVVDESTVYQPVDQTDAMYIITRFSQSYQTRNPNCTVDENGLPGPCDVPWIPIANTSAGVNKSYSADIESFTIRFRCFFQARQYYMETRDKYYSQSCADMNGKMINYNGDQIGTYGNNGSDIVTVAKVLVAAGVDLNDISESPGNAEWNESKRHAGITLFFGIDFNGANGKPVEYTYSVTAVPKVEYKVTRSTAVGTNERKLDDTHGIKIFFVFSGNICRFDFQTLLINMVAGLGLLSVATLSTDFLMEYLMPLKDAYIKYKYKETVTHEHLKKKLTGNKLNTLETESASVNGRGSIDYDDERDHTTYKDHYKQLDA